MESVKLKPVKTIRDRPKNNVTVDDLLLKLELLFIERDKLFVNRLIESIRESEKNKKREILPVTRDEKLLTKRITYTRHQIRVKYEKEKEKGNIIEEKIIKNKVTSRRNTAIRPRETQVVKTSGKLGKKKAE